MADRMKQGERTKATEHVRNAFAVVAGVGQLLVGLRLQAAPKRHESPGPYLLMIGLEAELVNVMPYLQDALSILAPDEEAEETP